MSWFYNLKIGAKLLSSFILIAVITGIVGYTGMTNINKISDADTMLYEKITIPLVELGNIKEMFHRIRVNLYNMALSKTSADIEKGIQLNDEYIVVINKNSESFTKTIITDALKNAFEDFMDRRKEYRGFMKEYYQLLNENRKEEAIKLLNGEMEESRIVYQKAIEKMVELKINFAKQSAESNANLASQSENIMLVTMLISLFTALGLGLFISKIIRKPVSELVLAADKLAIGDIGVDVHSTSKDELGMLMDSFKKNGRECKGTGKRC